MTKWNVIYVFAFPLGWAIDDDDIGGATFEKALQNHVDFCKTHRIVMVLTEAKQPPSKLS